MYFRNITIQHCIYCDMILLMSSHRTFLEFAMETLKSTHSFRIEFRGEIRHYFFLPRCLNLFFGKKPAYLSARKQIRRKKFLPQCTMGHSREEQRCHPSSHKNHSQLGFWAHSGGSCAPLLYPLGDRGPWGICTCSSKATFLLKWHSSYSLLFLVASYCLYQN